MDFQTKLSCWAALPSGTASILRVVVFLGSKEIVTDVLTSAKLNQFIAGERKLFMDYAAYASALRKQKAEKMAVAVAGDSAKSCSHFQWCEYAGECSQAK